MIIKRVKIKKAIALLLLLSVINQIFAPSIAFALTSGPTAPEATSFEPIDTTDMVDPLTGDFTYNLPLMEVPGPEGGYPLSLSYHAGIMPNEDASWVGLGWTLNPGALTRNVNGFPDDWYLTNTSRRDYWAGGTQTNYNIGVTVGLLGPIGNVSFGLSFSQDTYRGFGVGMSMGVGVGIPNTPLGVSSTVGMTPYGEPIASVGLAGTGNVSFLGASTLGIGLSTNFESVSTTVNASSMGISMTSDGSGAAFTAGGIASSTSNSKAGNISTSTSGFSIGIPLSPILSINLGFSKVRYWSDETTSTKTHGSLYASGWGEGDDQAFDSYALPDPNTNFDSDPNKGQGGAYPDFDVYSVSGQGMSGNMRPYNFQGEVVSQNRYENNKRSIEYFSPKAADGTPEFRFINDFSNSYRQTYSDYSNINLNLKLVQPPFDESPKYGNNDGNYGYGGWNKVAGSKSIKYFVTSQDGSVTGDDFIKPTVAGLDRKLHTGNGSNRHIAGFAITNSSGVTYHYNLPAYSYDEEMYQAKINGTTTFNRQTRSEGYAYTWFLTSITGPDYVDRNGDKKVNDGDWGYWMNFEYGLWADNYIWRNPSEGYHRDEDNEFKDVSMGRKQIYYLNAIRTRSHVALFEKDVRVDGKGASPDVFVKGQNNGVYSYDGHFDENSAKSMRLDKIYLLNASDAGIVSESTSGSIYNHVLDKEDVNSAGRNLLESKSLRIIDFNYNYDLCKGTTNSFNSFPNTLKSGKLTLASLTFRGVGGSNLTPPMEFDYGLSGAELKSADGTIILSGTYLNPKSTFVTGNGTFEVGDLLETDEDQTVFCGVIIGKTLNGTEYTYTLKNSRFSLNGATGKRLRTTKNPPYNKDAYDMWGMYKSDYEYDANENLSRFTSIVSNQATDVWSLRKIKTSLGSEISIKYEGDTYSKSVLNKNMSMIIGEFVKVNDRSWILKVNTGGQDLSKLYKVGDNVKFLALVYSTRRATTESESRPSYFTMSSDNPGGVRPSPADAPPPYIESIGQDQIQIGVNEELGQTLSSYYKYNNNGIERDLRIGNLQIYGATRYYGGGIRVRSVEIDDKLESRYKTNYSYNAPGTTVSSGTTSYEPTVLEVDDAARFGEEAKSIYRKDLRRGISDLYRIAREIPPPGVMYRYVTTENEAEHLGQSGPVKAEGKTVYEFEVFRDNMIGRVEVSPRQTGSSLGKTQYIRNWVLKKFVSPIGALKRTTKYDPQNQKLSETINNYLHDGLENLPFEDFMNQYEQRLSRYGYQGLLKERYAEVKETRESNGTYVVRSTLSGREEFPSISLGQSSNDYVTGIKTGVENLAFDFYSGAVTKMAETDTYGNRFLTVIQPAYRQFSAMGLKVNNEYNRNMLSQEAGRTVYKVNSVNEYLGVATAVVKTWSNTIRVDDENGDKTTYHQNWIWRPKDTYQWMASGTSANNITPIGIFTPFNYAGVNNQSWRKAGEISRYNINSVALEGLDQNNNYASSRLGYKGSKVVITSSPSRYGEIAYAGVEDPLLTNGKLSTGISLGAGVVSTAMAHTGSKSISLAPGASGITYQVPFTDLDPVRRDYYASVWVKSLGDVSGARMFYQIDNQAAVVNVPTFQKVAAGWYLLEMRIPASALSSGNGLTVGCKNLGAAAVNFDDFRFQPFNSPTTSYGYDLITGELKYIYDNNNLFTKYEYDATGRLVKVYKEVLGKASTPLLKESVYNYAKPLVAVNHPTPFYARVENSNVRIFHYGNQDDYTYETFADVHLRFYSDAACTIPFTIGSSMSFDVADYYSWSDTFGGGSTVNSSVYTAPGGSNKFYIGNLRVASSHNWNEPLNGSMYDIFSSDFKLVPYLSGNYYPMPTFNIIE